MHIDKIIGFYPYSALTDDEKNAVYGISYLRGRKVYDSPVNKDQAIQLLKLNRHILDKFENIFNFLDLSRLNDM